MIFFLKGNSVSPDYESQVLFTLLGFSTLESRWHQDRILKGS